MPEADNTHNRTCPISEGKVIRQTLIKTPHHRLRWVQSIATDIPLGGNLLKKVTLPLLNPPCLADKHEKAYRNQPLHPASLFGLEARLSLEGSCYKCKKYIASTISSRKFG